MTNAMITTQPVIVELFANYRDIVGWKKKEMEIPVGSTVIDLLHLIQETDPAGSALLRLPCRDQ